MAQQYLFDAQLLTRDDGVTNLRTTAIHKDRDGFLWLGTGYGLNRYDGYTYKHYTKEKNGLSQNVEISRISEDEAGNLWLFYVKPAVKNNQVDIVDVFNPKTETVIPPEEYFTVPVPFKETELNISKIIDPKHRLWLTTTKGELFLYTEGHFKKIFEQKNAIFNCLTIDRQDNIWLSWNEVVVCINQAGKILDKFTVSHPIFGIWMGADETLWLKDRYQAGENWNRGSVWYKKKGTEKIEPFNFFDDRGIINSRVSNHQGLYRDQKGYWYYLVYQGTFNLFDNEGKWILRFDSLLEINKIINITNQLEEEQSIWWGCSMGLLKTSNKKNPFQLIHSTEGRFSNCRSITEDKAGNIYFLNHGIFKWTPQKSNITKLPYGTSGDALIYKDSFLWSGNFSETEIGFQIDLVTNEVFKYLNPNSPYVFSMIESAFPNRFLAGTDRGLEYIDYKLKQVLPFEKYKPNHPTDHLLKKSEVKYLYKNQSGIWLATNNGIFLVDENQGILQHFNAPESLPFLHIRHIYEDKQGIFWLATKGGGLIQWQPDLNEPSSSKSKQFTSSEGLSNNNLYAVYEDEYNRLWIPSDKGLMCMDKTTHQVRTYLTEDGLPHNEFNQSSHFKAKDGTLYFGGLGGLISFHPDDIGLELEDKTPLEITAFFLLEGEAETMTDKTKLLRETHEIIMKPTDKLFELQFGLLDYQSPEKHSYAYQIEGYTNYWQQINQNFIRITNLPYGDYILRIKGKHINRNWSEKELEFNVRVLKPFYLEWWFIAILAMAAIGMAIAIVKRREIAFQKDKQRLEEEVQKRTLTIQQQAEELKVLDKAKTRFFSNVTHEFRTPLTLIIGPLEQVITEQPPPTIFRRRLNGILKNARHLLTLINQMLDLSKIESGRMRTEITRGDIIIYTEELTKRFEPLAYKKELRLTFIAGQENWETHFDKDKWDKIVYNLLANAIKFTKPGGDIQLSLKQLQKEEVEYIRLDVKDSGIGIEKKQLEQIFNRFYQADNSSTRVQGGTGIGLALVKELVEMQGGEIWVTSEVKKGTSFEIHLPVLKAKNVKPLIYEPVLPTIPSPSTEQAEWASTIKTPALDEEEKLELLLIDDNEEIREYIRYCMDASKYNITEAINGEEGIQKALTLIPDLIISDVMMPKKDGFEVTQAIRNNVSTSHIPLILLTAKASLESRLKGLQRGADAYLTKPFSPKELALRIQKLIEIRQLLQKRYRNSLETANNDHYQQEDEFIVNLREYILQNIDESNLNGDHIGKHFGMSRVHLYRKLKALTNVSIGEFVKSIRLKKALELIREGNLNVSEIAWQTGFSSVSYFSTSFKKAFGKTPSEM